MTTVIDVKQYKLDKVPTDRLLLDPENPRFLHLQLQNKRDLTQDDLNSVIWDEDATITLSRAVAREGILNPIVVFPTNSKFLVIDGNRRVVTLRRLISEHAKAPERVTFAEVPAYIIPPVALYKSNWTKIYTSGFLKKSEICTGSYKKYC